jgi:hypothetical protein
MKEEKEIVKKAEKSENGESKAPGIKKEVEQIINEKAAQAIEGINSSPPPVIEPPVSKPLAGPKIPKLIVSDDVAPKKRGRGRPKKEVKPEPIQLVTGDLLLFLTDQIVPKFIALANNSFQKNEAKKIDWNELRLEPSDKAELKIIADNAAAKIGILADPITTYAIMVSGIYAMKLFIPKE